MYLCMRLHVFACVCIVSMWNSDHLFVTITNQHLHGLTIRIYLFKKLTVAYCDAFYLTVSCTGFCLNKLKLILSTGTALQRKTGAKIKTTTAATAPTSTKICAIIKHIHTKQLERIKILDERNVRVRVSESAWCVCTTSTHRNIYMCNKSSASNVGALKCPTGQSQSQCAFATGLEIRIDFKLKRFYSLKLSRLKCWRGWLNHKPFFYGYSF